MVAVPLFSARFPRQIQLRARHLIEPCDVVEEISVSIGSGRARLPRPRPIRRTSGTSLRMRPMDPAVGRGGAFRPLSTLERTLLQPRLPHACRVITTVAKYWPEFAANGKQDVVCATRRLARIRLPTWTAQLTHRHVRLGEVNCPAGGKAPLHQPGSLWVYHGMTWGIWSAKSSCSTGHWPGRR